MRGFFRYCLHAVAGTVVFLLLGIVLFPFLFLAPLCLLSILFYPLFKLLLPKYMASREF